MNAVLTAAGIGVVTVLTAAILLRIVGLIADDGAWAHASAPKPVAPKSSTPLAGRTIARAAVVHSTPTLNTSVRRVTRRDVVLAYIAIARDLVALRHGRHMVGGAR